MQRIAPAIVVSLLFAASLQAQTAVFGPTELLPGQSVAVDVYNPSQETASGGMVLLDAESGRLLDRVSFSVAPGRGATVGFTGARGFVGSPSKASASDSPVVVGVLWSGADQPPLKVGEGRRVDADQKTIIGGFKSLSGMDSSTETIEDQAVSDPFWVAGDTVVRAAGLSGEGMTLVEVVRIADGAVVASQAVDGSGAPAVFGLDHQVDSSRDSVGGAHVIRMTALSGDLTTAVAVESRSAAEQGGNSVAIETLTLTHEGFERAAHEVAHSIQQQGDGR